MNIDSWLIIAGILAFALIIVFSVISAYRELMQTTDAVKKSNEKIAEAESKLEANPEKAKPAWDLARITLESYFNRNVHQVTFIFWLSVISMIAGFLIIAWGISQVMISQNATALAWLTGLAGTITEFLGATFLYLYRSTIQQAMKNIRTLEHINSVGMAMQILDTIPDEAKSDDLKSKTKAVLIELLMKQASSTENSNINDR